MGTECDQRVVILIDNYNYGRFLRAAIESALDQTWPNCQVLVVDDGSSDNSQKVISSFGNAISSILKSNGGQASAINAGFNSTAGSVWMLLDADDMLYPGTVLEVMAAFAQYPTTARVQFPLQLVDATGEQLPGTIPSNVKAMPNGDVSEMVLDHCDDIAWASMSGNAYADSTLRAIMPIPEDDYPTIGADVYLMNLAGLIGPVKSLEQVGGSYRVHGANADYRPGVDLERSRRIISLSETTHRQLAALALSRGIDERRTATIGHRSLTLMAHRMIIARLARPNQSLSKRIGLVWDGIGAANGRKDVSLRRRCLFIGWLCAMCALPLPIVRPIARLPFR
jgi:glycosyltransferase involved in cell wall biosynthesis